MEDQFAEVIGAMQSEAQFEAAVKELETAGINRGQINVLAQEQLAISCTAVVGCDVSKLPHTEINVWDDRQQLRVLLTSLAATAASVASTGAVLAATGAAAPAVLAAAVSAGSAVGLGALFGRHHESKAHTWAEQQLKKGGIVVIVYPFSAAQLDAATMILHTYCGREVLSTSQA